MHLPITDPTLIFFVVLLIILTAPIIMGRLRIPHIIGMVLAGVLVGKYGLNILDRDQSFELFGRVGLLYIMFLAGLEMDMQGFKKSGKRVALVGILTFIIPFMLTLFISIYLLHYSLLASVLLSCIMSSNTLIAYPIVIRYGLQRHSVTTLSVGASMLALLLALVAVAALVNSYSGGSGVVFWLLFVAKFIVYCAVSIMLIPRLTRWFLRKYSDSVMQFIYVLAIMFLSAAVCEGIGLEGILGAFFSGLIMNRYIPVLSPLMNRLEFIGNALFIPYFLIGVGMLINLRLLFEGDGIIMIVVGIVISGTLGKAIAAYFAAWLMHLPRHAARLIFGLTSAHAAGSIAMVMIGMELETEPGKYLIGDDMLNGVVVMILFTCIISTMMTEAASRTIIYKEKEALANNEGNEMGTNYISGTADKVKGTLDDEKILIPLKYPETCDTLVNLAILMRNPKLERGLIGLNVVYDDVNAPANQVEGRKILERAQKTASASDVRMQTQVRLATNIANGIKHAFKEYDASEIILGQHIHDNSTRRFWGEFAQSLFNGLSRQIIIVRCAQPLNTLRGIHVAVPSRAELEPGFTRWLERLSRLAGGLECRIVFHGRQESLNLINAYVKTKHKSLRAEYVDMPHWNGFKELAASVKDDNMLAVVTARQGTISYKSAMERLPDEITHYYKGNNIMLIFPDQYGNRMDVMSFAVPQHKEQSSAYQWFRSLFVKD